MPKVVVYSKAWCPFCVRAKRLLKQLGANFDEIDLGIEPGRRAEMIAASGQRTVPQIWIGETHVGGCDELFAAHRSGALAMMLAAKD